MVKLSLSKCASIVIKIKNRSNILLLRAPSTALGKYTISKEQKNAIAKSYLRQSDIKETIHLFASLPDDDKASLAHTAAAATKRTVFFFYRNPKPVNFPH